MFNNKRGGLRPPAPRSNSAPASPQSPAPSAPPSAAAKPAAAPPAQKPRQAQSAPRKAAAGAAAVAEMERASAPAAPTQGKAPKAQAAKAQAAKASETPAQKPKPDALAQEPAPVAAPVNQRSEQFYAMKSDVYAALMDAMDMTRIAHLDRREAEEEISAIVNDIVAIKNYIMSTTEQDSLVGEICDDVLGYGPLESLLARDDIADIMVNGADQCFIETNGKIEDAGIRFRNNQQLLEICQRMVSKVGRRVDEASPICDARLLDGSRVNVIAPPLAIDGASLTIRKFKKDKLTMANLVKFGSISEEGARVLQIIGRVRCNVLISGGTGSGKTTLLNCMSGYAANDERIITCEDSAELQLQQPHVVRLETRPPNIEGKGEITMRQLVKNCLRMRPERIIVGEVRGPEAFDLLQAMNTGHDGSMGTLHANSPREALSRLESMITMGGFSLPAKTIREMICSAVNVIVQAQRLRDGSRRITHISEVLGMEGETVVTQDLVKYEIVGEDERGKLIGEHKGCGVAHPAFYDRARTYNLDTELKAALAAMDEG